MPFTIAITLAVSNGRPVHQYNTFISLKWSMHFTIAFLLWNATAKANGNKFTRTKSKIGIVYIPEYEIWEMVCDRVRAQEVCVHFSNASTFRVFIFHEHCNSKHFYAHMLHKILLFDNLNIPILSIFLSFYFFSFDVASGLFK